MSRWEVDLLYERKFLDSDRRYLEIIKKAHPAVGYLRYREMGETFVVTVEAEAATRAQATEQALIQARQLWVHTQPSHAEVGEWP